ncbi:MAG: hypothetical protein FWD68_19000 [Alphaproteobacteria bacterium]|nr:hypothetical protein [Alphaproteobacteria bacterium]
MQSGSLDAFKIGRRTLVTTESIRRLRLRAPGAGCSAGLWCLRGTPNRTSSAEDAIGAAGGRFRSLWLFDAYRRGDASQTSGRH